MAGGKVKAEVGKKKRDPSNLSAQAFFLIKAAKQRLVKPIKIVVVLFSTQNDHHQIHGSDE